MTFSLKFLGTPKAAVCFAHPGHEWLFWGEILRLQADLYYLSPGAFTDTDFPTRFLESLRNAGFQGNLIFGCRSEAEVFERLLARDCHWFAKLRCDLTSWLEAIQADIVCCDAYEWYNSAHDLVPLLVDSALRSTKLSPSVERFEIGIAMQTVSESECLHEARRKDWQQLVVSEDAVIQKHRLLESRIGLQNGAITVNDDLVSLANSWGNERFAWEFWRISPKFDYTLEPVRSPWPTYDERGLQRVQAGRSTEAIRFKSHFAPVARYLDAAFPELHCSVNHHQLKRFA